MMTLLSYIVQVYQRLLKLNLCVSHVTTSNLINLLGVEHDILVKRWRDHFVPYLKDMHSQVRDIKHYFFEFINVEI